MRSNRYEQLVRLCWGALSERVLEIGTWNGERAKQLCARGAEYVGFDLFEYATDETDEVELNVKPHCNVADVKANLREAGVESNLIKGNTRETLPRYNGRPFDFVFIDGGHSEETIASDWKEVQRLIKPGTIVCFDDYYEPPKEGLGCNKIVDEMEDKMFSSKDPVVQGGTVQFVAVLCK